MKVHFSPEEMEELFAELRPMSTKTAKEIIEIANVHPTGNGGVIAGTLGCLVLQTILTSMAVTMFEPGSNEGHDWLIETYDKALADAVERWAKPDLKLHYSKKNKRH